MIRPRWGRPKVLRAVAAAGLAGFALLGVWSLVRPAADSEAYPPPPSQAASAQESELAVAAPLVGRLAAARPSLPRLRTLSASDWELRRAAVADLTPPEGGALAELDRTARQKAALAVRLTPEEAAKVGNVYQRSDSGLAALEEQVDSDRGTLAGPVVRRLHDAASEEYAALTRVLGPERARALRTATNAAYREGWPAVRGADASLAVVSVARRKMAFLWMGMGGQDGPHDPKAEE